jgi:hypothetical protein
MMTQIAVLSFFQSAFASAASLRSEAHKMLEQGIANDFSEASFTR